MVVVLCRWVDNKPHSYLLLQRQSSFLCRWGGGGGGGGSVSLARHQTSQLLTVTKTEQFSVSLGRQQTTQLLTVTKTEQFSVSLGRQQTSQLLTVTKTEQFSVSLGRQQTSQLLTVTTTYNGREAPRVDSEDAIYRSLVRMSTQSCRLLAADYLAEERAV